MDYIILDLEWNGAYSRKRKAFFNEIIEIGAIKVNNEMKIIDSFSAIIRPQIGKKISTRVKKLTRITEDDLVKGVSFLRAMKMLRRFMRDAILVTWGLSDIKVLTDNYYYYSGKKRIDFIKRFLNLQEYCSRRLNFLDGNNKLGLSKALDMLNIEVDESNFHRAVGDCRLEYACLKKLYDRKLLEESIYNCDDEFYKEINFKNTVIKDINDSRINKDELTFICPKCGEKISTKGNWQLKNKVFRVAITCSKCQNEFIGKVKIWLTYSGVLVKKSIDLKSDIENE